MSEILTSYEFRPEIYEKLNDLPLEEFDKLKFSIYVISYDWVYLFANIHAQNRNTVLLKGKHIKEIWHEMPQTNFVNLYNLLKDGVENRGKLQVKSTSPLTNNSIEIKGFPLQDCYLFCVSELPDKEALLTELKSILNKKK